MTDKARMGNMMKKSWTCGMFPLTLLLGMLAGCSSTPVGDNVVGWSNADTPPSGLVFGNGMPPSSQGPRPEWYAQRFNRPRGIGEALKQNRRALWDRDDGSFAYYIGGELFAQFHPWEHYLRIRTDHIEEANLTCLWTEDGSLSLNLDSGSAPAEASDTCNHLLDTLARHVAPGVDLSSGS